MHILIYINTLINFNMTFVTNLEIDVIKSRIREKFEVLFFLEIWEKFSYYIRNQIILLYFPRLG